MKRIKLKESDLTRLIERMVWEVTTPTVGGKPKNQVTKPKRKVNPKPPRPPKPTKPFNVQSWSGPFIKKIDNFIRNKNFKGALSFLKGRLATWSKKGANAGPAWTKQLKQKSTVVNKEIKKVEKAMKTTTGGGTTTPPTLNQLGNEKPKKLKESDLRRIVKGVMNQKTRYNGRGVDGLIKRITNR